MCEGCLRTQSLRVVAGGLKERARSLGPDPEDLDEVGCGFDSQAGEAGLDGPDLRLQVLDAPSKRTESQLRGCNWRRHLAGAQPAAPADELCGRQAPELLPELCRR